MTHDTDQLDQPLHWMAALFSWILPGFGQIMAGHRRRGALAMIGVLGLFLSGLLIGGVDSVDRREDPLWFYAQAGAGPIAFAADWANASLLKTGKVGELVESPPQNPRAAAPMVSTFKTVTLASEIGILYCALAGLMNVVVVLDALKRPVAQLDTGGGRS
ncbi:MAG: hypothetical protein EXS01_05760 [Phycisphaerales bacterium]|nr:hypothetical protein [Phycisphaerales bacterium]